MSEDVEHDQKKNKLLLVAGNLSFFLRPERNRRSWARASASGRAVLASGFCVLLAIGCGACELPV